MIIKSFELNKIDLKKNQFFLFYGGNEGFKKQIIEEKFKKFYSENIYTYEEGEILQKKEILFNNILTKSFFEKEKLIIINRATDKIKDIIEEILDKEIEDLVLILNAQILEKKSKIRSLFEKNKTIVCIPFYEDNNQTLSGVASIFFKENKIPISQQSINLVVQRCRGDRLNLQNELNKIKDYARDKKKIEIEDLLKLTNLAENYSISELIDGCLAKNIKKTINILNENNYSVEDCILIIRTFLIKSKRLLKLSQEVKNRKNIDEAISAFKPIIFWKDKETIKQQVKSWSFINIEKLIYKISEIELLIKKNSSNSVNILSNFIIEEVNASSN
jgi:DNA polymerase III subunit delta